MAMPSRLCTLILAAAGGVAVLLASFALVITCRSSRSKEPRGNAVSSRGHPFPNNFTATSATPAPPVAIHEIPMQEYTVTKGEYNVENMPQPVVAVAVPSYAAQAQPVPAPSYAAQAQPVPPSAKLASVLHIASAVTDRSSTVTHRSSSFTIARTNSHLIDSSEEYRRRYTSGAPSQISMVAKNLAKLKNTLSRQANYRAICPRGARCWHGRNSSIEVVVRANCAIAMPTRRWSRADQNGDAFFYSAGLFYSPTIRYVGNGSGCHSATGYTRLEATPGDALTAWVAGVGSHLVGEPLPSEAAESARQGKMIRMPKEAGVRSVYGGLWFLHYGHFLVETLARLWVLTDLP